MDSNQWIIYLVLGGFAGMLGQGIRAAIGIKKLQDEAGDEGRLFSEKFSASRFFASLFIGFIAGSLTIFFMIDENSGIDIEKEHLLALMVAGYAGADTIEGLASKILPKSPGAGTGIARQ